MATTKTTPARKAPADRKTKATAKADEAPAKRYSVIGHELLFETVDGEQIRLSLNVKLDVLEKVLDLQATGMESGDDMAEKVRAITGFLRGLLGAEYERVGLMDMMPLFNAFSEELGAMFGASMGESQRSS